MPLLSSPNSMSIVCCIDEVSHIPDQWQATLTFTPSLALALSFPRNPGGLQNQPRAPLSLPSLFFIPPHPPCSICTQASSLLWQQSQVLLPTHLHCSGSIPPFIHLASSTLNVPDTTIPRQPRCSHTVFALVASVHNPARSALFNRLESSSGSPLTPSLDTISLTQPPREKLW